MYVANSEVLPYCPFGRLKITISLNAMSGLTNFTNAGTKNFLVLLLFVTAI